MTRWQERSLKWHTSTFIEDKDAPAAAAFTHAKTSVAIGIGTCGRTSLQVRLREGTRATECTARAKRKEVEEALTPMDQSRVFNHFSNSNARTKESNTHEFKSSNYDASEQTGEYESNHLVFIPEGACHQYTNTGTEDALLFVVYDPPAEVPKK